MNLSMFTLSLKLHPLHIFYDFDHILLYNSTGFCINDKIYKKKMLGNTIMKILKSTV